MIQDIEPRIFSNKYEDKKASKEDLFLVYKEDQVLVNEGKDKLWYPSFNDFLDSHPDLMEDAQFLFTIDDINYFLVKADGLDGLGGWTYVTTSSFRKEKKYWRSFAGVVGWQLNRWYDNHKYCSRCSHVLEVSKKERMLHCPSCGMTVYPTISPCVIVGVYQGDNLLLTKYAGRAHQSYALIAGFNEIGESLEQTVKREVMEEVGLRVKNIKYYKSQPWPFTDTLLSGFFAELDGDDTINIDKEELAIGTWVSRQNIPNRAKSISLTGEMMEIFRKGDTF